MKPLARFWKSLDFIPGATTDKWEWILRLRGEWPLVHAYLLPTGRIAGKVLCPSPGGDGCPRTVVALDHDRFRAVCSNAPAECDPIELTRDEITCLALNQAKLAAALAGPLKLARGEDLRIGPYTQIGVHQVVAGVDFPVLLLIPGLTEPPERVLHLNTTAAILVPTPQSISVSMRTCLESEGHLVIILSNTIGLEGDRLVALRPPEALFAKLRDQLMPATAGEPKRLWVLPPNAKWEELKFEFTASEVVNVRFRGKSKRFEPEQFGLKSKKSGRPQLDWVALQSVARQGGVLSWINLADTQKMQKRKQSLAKRLHMLFGIEGDAFQRRPGEPGYEARFKTLWSVPKGEC